jgi:hypothetical protein
MYPEDYDVITLDNHRVLVEEMYSQHKQMDEFYTKITLEEINNRKIIHTDEQEI